MEFARDRAASLLAMCMGAGKSATALALLDEWWCRRTLLLCPTSVRAVWRGQIPKHSSRDYNVVILDHGSVERRMLIANDAFWLCKKPAIIVINYEAAWRWAFSGWALGKKWDCVILDEGHRAQEETHISRFCAAIGKRAEHRLVLTGSPLTQNPLTVWGQARFLDPTVFGEDLRAFRERYEDKYAISARKAVKKCDALFAAKGWPLLPWPFERMKGTLHNEEYLAKLSKIAYRVESDVLDLPPLTIERRTFTLSASARKLYDAIQAGHTEEIESGQWANPRGSYAITMRLQQITSGWLPDKDGNPVAVDGGKAACLADILDAAGGEPVVVFTRFVHDLDIVQGIAERLGLQYGEVSGRRKDGLTEIGTMPEGLDVVGIEEEAGGVGVDMSRARLVVDYSPSWKRAVREQKWARVRRPPQTKPVIVYQLIAENTIDDDLKRALEARDESVAGTWSDFETPAQP
jgi:SNF2 family DNA or RNA helicase